ncbi:MAG: hypothetical protein IKR13_05045 [Victivallales bacterium]|nr:hypothetical protein [Victivallales bacterium]
MKLDHRYTCLPSEAVTRLLDSALPLIAQDIDAIRPARLAAVVLGGGYGRGEGGVLRTPQGDHLYNDLDFFVFSQNASARERAEIDQAMVPLAQRWSQQLAVAVDFGPAKNLSALPKVANTLMYQELLRGHLPVWGTARLAELLPELPAEKLPVSEALRLLMNRGMGLLLAAERLANGHPDHDFIVLNMHKSLLGSGDALLLGTGHYAWHATERIDAFRELATRLNLPGEFVEWYATGLHFKQEPSTSLPDQPWDFWQNCRNFWRCAVRTLAATPSASQPAEVADGLHLAVRPECSFKNLLRWTLRTHSLRTCATAFDPPAATILAMLFAELEREEHPVVIPEKLLRLWQLFN